MRLALVLLLAWQATTPATKKIILRDPDALYCVSYGDGNLSCVDLATARARLLADAPPCDPTR